MFDAALAQQDVPAALRDELLLGRARSAISVGDYAEGERGLAALRARLPVVEAHLVSGDYDYLLRVVVKDTRDYERLLREKLYKIKGIRHSRSSFVLRTLKKADLPLFAT